MSDEEVDDEEDNAAKKEGENEIAAANTMEEIVSRNFKYTTLCEYLDRMQRIHWRNKFGKQQVFKALVAKWSATAVEFTNKTISFYPVLRIMANSVDGRKFNMKSKKMISKVCKVLCLPPKTKKELLDADLKSASLSIEKLSEEVAQRNPALAKEALSLFDVNDSLCKITDKELTNGELERLLRACTTTREVYWLLQVLVRRMERVLHVTSAHLVRWMHPKGVELRQAGVTLRKICSLAAEGKMTDDSSILFRRFEPMLLSRIRHGSGNVYDKLIHFCGKQFFVEVKYDGEHFLLHRGPGGEMRYYSRAQNDFTRTIAPMLDHKISSFFASSVESCILDVELLLWDINDEKFVGKGVQASDGRIYDVKALRSDGAVEPSIAVFDVLFLNGRSLLDVPLQERLTLLYNGNILQKQDKTKIFLSEFKIIRTRDEFATFYEKAVKAGEEGIVVKKMDSTYKIGMRQATNGWFKVKPFHLGNETLDLAIVGVDLGRGGKISNYSVATLRDGKFFMVGKIGTGLDETTRTFLRNRLTRNHGFLKGDMVPDWIHMDYISSDLPSNFIHIDNMQVVEIRAKGLRNDRLYAPTLKSYRDDKFVKDIDQYEDFLNFDQDLRMDSIENALSVTDPRKRNASAHLAGECQVKKTHVEKINQDLKGKQICVLRGTATISTQDLEEIIVAFGGTYVANPGPKTLFVVTGEPKHVKSKSVIKSNKYNVIGADWLVACKDAGKVIPVTEKEVVHVVDSSLYSLFKDDGFTEDSDMSGSAQIYTVAGVSAMLENIKVVKRKKPTAAELALRKQLLKEEKFDRFFGQMFYLHNDLSKIQKTYVQILLRMHGADLSTKMNSTVSYIVVSERKQVGNDLLKKGTVVDIAWLEKTLDI